MLGYLAWDNTDRPETIFEAKSNTLVPPINPEWITSMVNEVYNNKEPLGTLVKNKKSIYGEPGQVSKLIVKVLNNESKDGDVSFYPWLHQRINLWKEKQLLDYM